VTGQEGRGGVTILWELTEGPGYCLDRLTPGELAMVRQITTRQYLERLAVLAPDLVGRAAREGIDNYHTLPVPFAHSRAWPKETRLLPSRHQEDFTAMGFFRRVEEEFGPVMISHGELNWRLVRPRQPSDVGPVHQDRWFWDGGYGTMPPGYGRFKVWVAVHTEPGANGLKVRPDSHKEPGWGHHFEERDGVLKPVLDEDERELNLVLLPLAPGDILMFHDDLLHGGCVNQGRHCRVSVELTILVPGGIPRPAARAA
jgi:hypothetical protein